MLSFARHSKSKISNWWWTVDKVTFVCTLVLILIGAILVFSASPSAAHRDRLPDEYAFMKKQGVFIAMGIVLMVGISMQSLRTIRRVAVLGFVAAFIGILLTYVVGDATKGAARWIKFAGFSLQPSEFVKPMLIVVTAWFLDARKRIADFPGMLVATMVYVLTAAFVFKQPDLGMTMLISFAFGVQLMLAGLPLLWVFGLGGLLVVVVILAYFFVAHVHDRVDQFLASEVEIGSQIQQSLDAFANGNLLGRGPGGGVIKMHLPDVHTDFIFSLAGEEYGVWMPMVIVILFSVIVIRPIVNAMKENNLFQMYAAAGLACSIGAQAMINMCSALKLIPSKGMTLPFISYGGSSMWASCITMGMLLAITRKNAAAEDKDNG